MTTYKNDQKLLKLSIIWYYELNSVLYKDDIDWFKIKVAILHVHVALFWANLILNYRQN